MTMTNEAMIKELRETRFKLLQTALQRFVALETPEDCVMALSGAMEAQSEAAARGGNYDRAALLELHAKFLAEIPERIDNYDPTPT